MAHANNSNSDIEIIAEDRDSSDCSIEVIKSHATLQRDLHHGSIIDEKKATLNKHPVAQTDTALSMDGQQAPMDMTEHQVENNHGDNIPQQQEENIMCNSYKEISSDSDCAAVTDDNIDDVTRTCQIDDNTPLSSPSPISPNHRLQYHESDNNSDSALNTATVISPNNTSTHSDANITDLISFSSCSETGTLTSPAAQTNMADTIDRPDSLVLPKPLQYYEKKSDTKTKKTTKKKTHRREISNSSISNVSQSSSTDALIEEACKTPLHRHGSIIQEGDMIAFVADGLNDMIRLSSPLSRTSGSLSGSLQSPDTHSTHSSSVSSSSTSALSDVTSSASEWSRDCSRMSRHSSPSILTASPDDIPPVDPRALMDVENHARQTAASLDHMLSTLQQNLFKMSALSYHCLDAYKDSVDSTCDSVDASIKAMYAMMAKCEELSKAMQPTYKLHTEIKDIQRLLDCFENQMVREDK